MPSSRRYWGTLSVASILIMVTDIVLIARSVLPLFLTIPLMLLGFVLLVISLVSLVRRKPPR